jgi:hypothetical protein
MVIVDRMTKMRHFIPYYAGESNLNPNHVARLFLRHVWKHYALPDSIISDKGSIFLLYFWNSLYKLLGIAQKLSTAFYLESDG